MQLEMGKQEMHQLCYGKIRQPLGRPKSRWESNTEIDLSEVSCEGGRWMELPQGRVLM
jgi:hypothetical protein